MKNAFEHTFIFLFCLSALVCAPTALAGPIAEIGDIGVKFALINIWKGLAGLALFIAGAYMLGNRRPFRYKIMAVAVAGMVFTMTAIGALLFVGEFWPVIEPIIKSIAAIILYPFS